MVMMERDLSLEPEIFKKEYKRKVFWRNGFLTGIENMHHFDEHFYSKKKEYLKLFQQNAECAVSYKDDVLIGFIWYVKGKYHDPLINHTFYLKDDEIFQLAGFLAPEYRGSWMVLDGMRYTHRHYEKEGYRRVIVVVDSAFETNLRLHFKLGFRERGTLIHSKKLLFRKWSWSEDYAGPRFDQFRAKPHSASSAAAPAP